ncbi:MAG: hypothetical protein L0154_10085 [Chloroflexi bacterium]|nr:hypothetical protein [Chloroflexota bacterium]
MVEERNYCLLYILLGLCFMAANYVLLLLVASGLYNPFAVTHYRVAHIDGQNIYLLSMVGHSHSYHKFEVNTGTFEYVSNEEYETVVKDHRQQSVALLPGFSDLPFEKIIAVVELPRIDRYLIIASEVKTIPILNIDGQDHSIHVVKRDRTIDYSIKHSTLIRGIQSDEMQGIRISIGFLERLFYILIFAAVVMLFASRRQLKNNWKTLFPILIFAVPLYACCWLCLLWTITFARA